MSTLRWAHRASDTATCAICGRAFGRTHQQRLQRKRTCSPACANRAKSSGIAMNDLFPACVEAEQASLAGLKEAWNGYSAASREKCLKTVANDQHYADLQACIVAAEAMQHTEKR